MNNNRGERIVWKTAQNVQRAWGKLHYGRVVCQVPAIISQQYATHGSKRTSQTIIMVMNG